MTDRPPHIQPWSVMLFRTLVTAEAVLAFAQAVLAGDFLSGRYGALALHAAVANVSGAIAVALTVAAVLLWKPGGGPSWPALACGVLFAAEGAQIGMGYARVLSVHIPLGVAIVVALVLMLLWAWGPLDELTTGRQVAQSPAGDCHAVGRGADDRLAADRPSPVGTAAARTAADPAAELAPADSPSTGIPGPRTAGDTDTGAPTPSTPTPSTPTLTGEVTL